MMDLCDFFRKRNEFMWKSNQPGSELDETQHDSSNSFTALTAVSEHENSTETLDTRSNWPTRFVNDTQHPTAHESAISYSFTEKEENFRYPEKSKPRNLLQFSPPAEVYERDTGVSSLDEEFYVFDDGNARPSPF